MTRGASNGVVFRCDVVSAAQLVALAAAPLPLGVRAGPPRRALHRDLYLDTADGVLRRRGVTCRLRVGADDRHVLSLRIGAGDVAGADTSVRVDARVRAAEPAAALRENTTVARRLRGIVDPALLDVRVVLEVDRYVRGALFDWWRRPRVELHYDQVTVRREGATRAFQQLCVHRRRGPAAEAMRLAEALQREHGLRPLAADRRERAELLLKWMHPAAAPAEGSIQSVTVDEELRAGDVDFLNPELSLLAFQERVLALAEDPTTPLGERLRFLAIVAANLDEFFTVRVAGLKSAARESVEEQEGHGLAPEAQLRAVAARVRALVARHYAGFRGCASALAARGVRLRTWADLDDARRAALTERFLDEILPALTPLAMTLAPGHPLPHLPHLSLSLATVLLDPRGGPPRLAQVELPDTLPRFLGADGSDTLTADVVPIEEVVRANLGTLYPASEVDQGYFYRVTRAGDLMLDEENADDLLAAVDAATRRRPGNAIVRVEVERATPASLRELLIDELRREPGGDALALGPDDVYEIEGPLDLRAAATLPVPEDAALWYPPATPRDPLADTPSVFDEIAARDLLVHHPFESFEGTVVRFLREAAADPAVTAVKITLYRAGDHSPVVEALRDAAKRGKQVVAFVELKARFDEERNVDGVRALKKAGVHVVYGLVGLKTHAKVALVVRREADGQLRRYAHVGSGNYNARTALAYTDVSLLTADDAVATDVAELFNALTGSSAPPSRLARGALVSPGQLLHALLEQIEREAAHARAGREARIRIKVNGLSDAEVVRGLCRAARDGVRVELAVRGVCTLRPGVLGVSTGIRVVAHVGRFLEHSRVYHFANGGDARYYIGSADLRPRNLRRRVELLAPVCDPAARATLDRLLDRYLEDPTAWELMPNGTYVRRGGGASAQDVFARERVSGRNAVILSEAKDLAPAPGSSLRSP